MDNILISKIGAGRYIQGNGAIACIGQEIHNLGRKAFIIGGENALEASLPSIESSLSGCGIAYDINRLRGFCSYENLELFCKKASSGNVEVIIGVGGGKSIDLSKAVAIKLGIPILTVPTIAATCAAWTPLSIMYSQEGKPKGPLPLQNEINCCITDLNIISKAPARTLASGVADSFAKSEEISSGEQQKNLATTDVSVFTAYRMAKVIDEVLYQKAYDAYRDCINSVSSNALNDIVYANIAITGACSGFASGSSQLAMAHAFNNALRTGFTEQANESYHGEVVGVGLIVQMYYNNSPHIDSYKSICNSLNLPVTLKQLNIDPSEEIFDYILKFIIDKMQINASSGSIQKIKNGLTDIFS